jgi:probable rRNA maturation factor
MKMVEDCLAPGLEIDILVEAAGWQDCVPDARTIVSAAAQAALGDENPAGAQSGSAIELSILLTDDTTISELNFQWRGRTGPTNVLSFPAETDMRPADAPVLLGDVVIAIETVMAEAKDAGIAAADHLRHLVVHGVLHLCGYDHENDADADRMEGREIVILEALGVSDPYAAAERRAGGAGI